MEATRLAVDSLAAVRGEAVPDISTTLVQPLSRFPDLEHGPTTRQHHWVPALAVELEVI